MYVLGERSRKELQGVHPDLVCVVNRAIDLTIQDFAVHDGLRTESEQAMLVHKGASQTMNSKHRVQPDGFGHAVDLVPFINKRMRWEHAPAYAVAEAVRQAAKELGVRIRWGGAWCELTANNDPPHILVEKYIARRRASGYKSSFLDPVHHELMR